MSIPGQNIVGSIELSSRFNLTKYHNRYSFQVAIQMDFMDIPIGVSLYLSSAENGLHKTIKNGLSNSSLFTSKSSRVSSSSSDTIASTNKIPGCMLTNIK